MSNNKKLIDIDSILKNNPDVDVSELVRNLASLDELQKNGVDVGPNYNLGSPYSRPTPRKGPSRSSGSTLHAEPPKKM